MTFVKQNDGSYVEAGAVDAKGIGGEGKADIIAIETPTNFTPGEQFAIGVSMKNVGDTDILFVHVIDRDTGAILKEGITSIPAGWNWEWATNLTLTQNTDFRGRINVGHIG